MFRGFAGESLTDLYTAQLRRAIEDQLINFADLAHRLTALQGQKHVVLLSSGWDSGGSQNLPVDFLTSSTLLELDDMRRNAHHGRWRSPGHCTG